MSLPDWLRDSLLEVHQPSAAEVADLLAVADRDLADCRTPGLSADWRMNIAYNAALQLATAALAASGYRATRQGHHYRTIQSLIHTIGADQSLVRELDLFRRKRNVAEYERAGLASEHEAETMIALALRLRRAVEEWLRENYPDLMS
jgi:hypothetical protein